MIWFFYLLYTLITIIFLLIIIAYYTVSERKIMAAFQRRIGPNMVGFWGLLQAFADALKLLSKEMLVPNKANKNIFIIAPLIILTLSFTSWSVIPFGNGSFSANINYSLLFILSISSLNVYSIIIAGWGSNSKYAFLGALRSAAQMVSYEVSISIIILPIILLCSTLNFLKIMDIQNNLQNFWLPLLPCAIIFFISILAETNRSPFDLPEAEAELVAGYNVEYSSIIFAMFFLGEYSNMILMSTIWVILFSGNGG